MRITLDTNAFLISEKASAKEYISEWNWVTDQDIESAARQALSDIDTIWTMVGHGDVTCCKDHYEPCIWVSDIVMLGQDKMASVSLNLSDAIKTPCEDRPHSFRRIYHLAKSEIA